MTMKFTILGCGSSGGVPRPALGWGACDPADRKTCGGAPPAGRAARCGRHHGVLVDTRPTYANSPRCRVDRLDGVLYTHEHADQPTASTTCARSTSSSAPRTPFISTPIPPRT